MDGAGGCIWGGQEHAGGRGRPAQLVCCSEGPQSGKLLQLAGTLFLQKQHEQFLLFFLPMRSATHVCSLLSAMSMRSP